VNNLDNSCAVFLPTPEIAKLINKVVTEIFFLSSIANNSLSTDFS